MNKCVLTHTLMANTLAMQCIVLFSQRYEKVTEGEKKAFNGKKMGDRQMTMLVGFTHCLLYCPRNKN